MCYAGGEGDEGGEGGADVVELGEESWGAARAEIGSAACSERGCMRAADRGAWTS